MTHIPAFLEIFCIKASHVRIMNHKDILCIAGIGIFRKIIRARYQDFSIKNHHLIMGDTNAGIDGYGDTLLNHERSLGMGVFDITLIKKNAHVNTAFLGMNKGCCNIRICEAKGLHKNAFLGLIQVCLYQYVLGVKHTWQL